MELGMIGLGRMGAAMARRLAHSGHTVIGMDSSEEAQQRFTDSADGLSAVGTIPTLATSLSQPRTVWVMVPAGEATSATMHALAESLSEGDVVVEGGNTDFLESRPYAALLGSRGIVYIDAGVSGGLWGESEGYCIMTGGDSAAAARLLPIFTDLACEGGYQHVGDVGAGHYAKMVHNGIEYGIMQSIAEGFELLDANSHFEFDLHQLAELFTHGSVIRSWLMDLTAAALAPGSGFEEIEGVVDDSGEGRWTLRETIDEAVPLPAITAALYARFYSRDANSYQARLTAAMRNQFGGHAVHKESKA